MRTRGFEIIEFEQFVKNAIEPRYNSLDLYYNEIEEAYKKIILPRRATLRSSGYDFICPYDIALLPGETVKFNLGIKSYMMTDEELKLYPRSSLGIKHKIKIDNTIPKIDSDYYGCDDNDGDIVLSITNTDRKEDCWIKAGDRIVQGSFYKYLLIDNDNPVSEERIGGIGSTNG